MKNVPLFLTTIIFGSACGCGSMPQAAGLASGLGGLATAGMSKLTSSSSTETPSAATATPTPDSSTASVNITPASAISALAGLMHGPATTAPAAALAAGDSSAPKVDYVALITQMIKLADDSSRHNWKAVANDLLQLQPVRDAMPPQYLALADAAAAACNEAGGNPAALASSLVTGSGTTANNAAPVPAMPDPNATYATAVSPATQTELSSALDTGLTQVTSDVNDEVNAGNFDAADAQLKQLSKVPNLPPGVQQKVQADRRQMAVKRAQAKAAGKTPAKNPGKQNLTKAVAAPAKAAPAKKTN